MNKLGTPLKSMFHDPRLGRMAAFLGSIGIEIRAGNIDVPTLFPGSLISGGSLIVDEAKLVAPGDALHEAAQIALAPPERRSADIGSLEFATGGEEMTTIAWAWAALLELDLPPEIVFHGTAYKGGDSSNIIDCARRGIYIGFPLLQAWKMAFDEPNARRRGVKPFPHMVKWIRGDTLLSNS
ncbi:MAG: hypothetical protein M3N12_07270 [Verrucomicrobiota bacterium]|nr:hypothetical protein [Verrucomicrobiota bacterium]